MTSIRPTQPFRIRLAQIGPRLGDVDTNLQMHLQAMQKAASEQVDLLVFPELSLTGYYLRDLTADVALPSDAPELVQLAEATSSLDTLLGYVEEDANFGIFTSALYLHQGQRQHLHRKVYLPTYGMFDEGRYLSAGNSVRAFDTQFGRMGMLICEDIWHPMLPFLLAQQGMHYLVVTSNSPTRGPKPEGLHLQRVYYDMLATYARLFQIYVIFCNRVGYEDGVNFWGGSCVMNPDGEIIAQAPLLESAEVDAIIDPAEVRRARVSAPLLQDENLHLALNELGRLVNERA